MGTRDELERLCALMVQRQIEPAISQTLPLAEARDGFQAMLDGQTSGGSSSPCRPVVALRKVNVRRVELDHRLDAAGFRHTATALGATGAQTIGAGRVRR